jgi:SET domain-containing protein
MKLTSLFIGISPGKGRGVFTTKDIPAYSDIEVAPVIELTAKERKQIEGTKLYHYIFEWGKTKKKAAVALGFVSMYNHSFDPNCAYEMDYDAQTMTIRTLRKIKKGEELTFSYNGSPTDQTPLWFKTT